MRHGLRWATMVLGVVFGLVPSGSTAAAAPTPTPSPTPTATGAGVLTPGQTVRSLANGKCLDMSSCSSTNDLQLWIADNPAGTSSHRWGAWFGGCLDVKDAGASNVVWLYHTCYASSQQLWRVV